MQYNSETSISNRLAVTINTAVRFVAATSCRAILLSALCGAAVGLTACSDSLTSDQPDKGFEAESKPYAKALTPEAKQVVISAMEQERDMRQKAAAADKSKSQDATQGAQN